MPLSVTRTFVKYVDIGVFPRARRAFQVTRCNQCGDPPCVAACPTQAMYRRADGLVDFDKARCIGCKACMAACPYDAIFINPEDHSAEKCNFCAHRLELGLEPACVVVCPTSAILVGDLHDGNSAVSRIVHREAVEVRRPEKGTRPGVFYRGAHQATLDPLAAERPPADLFMWAERLSGASLVAGGHASPGTGEAKAVLAYDVPHRAPWDWRVSAYTWGAFVDRRHSFGDPLALQRLIYDAGFDDVQVDRVVRTIRLDDPGVFVRMNTMALVGMSPASSTMSDQERAALVDTLVDDSAGVVRQYLGDGGLSFELGANVATART